jgi:hypothetical protein
MHQDVGLGLESVPQSEVQLQAGSAAGDGSSRTEDFGAGHADSRAMAS